MRKRKSLIAATGLAAIVGLGSIVVSPPQSATAAGFMENSIGKLKQNQFLDTNLQNALGLVEGFGYLSFPIAIIGGGLFAFFLNRGGSEEAAKTVMAFIAIIILILALLVGYDKNFVALQRQSIKMIAALDIPISEV
ncbi:MAG: hypothetical protein ACRCYP_01700 [Alphaproteobacteria bacterium]